MYLILIIFLTLISTILTTPLVCDFIISLSGELVWPFSRILDRVLLFYLILFIVVFRKKLSLKKIIKRCKEEFTDKKKKILFYEYFSMLFLTAFATLIVLPIIVGSSSLEFQEKGIYFFLLKLPKVLIAALVIAFIEELIFRVLLNETLKKKFHFILALIFTNLIYALVHFIKPDKSYEYTDNFFSGFDYVGVLLQRSVDINLFYAFIALFVVGLTLSLVYEKRKSLVIIMGLHAGWILGIKMARYITTLPSNMSYPPSIGREFYLLTFSYAHVSIFIVAAFLYFLFKRNFHNSKQI